MLAIEATLKLSSSKSHFGSSSIYMAKELTVFSFCFLRFAYFRGEWRGRGRENPQADSPLSTEPEAVLHLRTLRSGPEPKPRVGLSTDCASQAP